MKHLSNNDFQDNLLANVPDGVAPQEAVNKRQLDVKISGDGTQKLTVSSAEPGAPQDGDIWLDEDGEDSFGELATKNFIDIYPVGKVYISVDNTNPGTMFGGTWELFGVGRMLIGVDSGNADIDAAEKTTGSLTHNHSLSDNGYAKISVRGTSALLTQHRIAVPNHSYNVTGTNFTGSGNTGTVSDGTSLGGGTDSAPSLPPAVAVYMFKRTA